jgi:hypothetical protein
MAPEQTRDARDAKPTADLFSAGATLFALVTSKPPMLLEALQERPEYLDGVHPSIRAVIHRACADDPAARYPDAVQMAEAVAAAYDDVVAAEGGKQPPAREAWMKDLHDALDHALRHLEDEKTGPPSPRRETKPRELKSSLPLPGEDGRPVERVQLHVAEKSGNYVVAGVIGTLGTLVFVVVVVVLLVVGLLVVLT